MAAGLGRRYTSAMQSPTRTARARLTVAGALLAAGTAGCQVEWGGGTISLEDPAPPPDTTAAVVELEPEQLPLPTGPFLHLVRLDSDGSARLTPLAGLGGPDADDPLTAVEIPSADDPTFRTRFDSIFLAPGAELELLARGGRLGSLVLEGQARAGAGSCASIATARAMISPGQDLPTWALALPAGGVSSEPPRRIASLEIERSMTIAGPVLAERLIGGDRAFLARLASMAAVDLGADTLSGMAATYLIADSLAAGPPGSNAVSLFFLARFEPARGFIPIWEEVRRYDAAEDKEIFEYLDWISIDGDRLDAVRRYDGSGVRLAVSWTEEGEDRAIAWVEPAECSAASRLGG